MCIGDAGSENQQRGSALAGVLMAMTLLLPLGALAVLQARIGLLTQQSLRSDVEALHAAEAGLACAYSRLDPSMDFGQLSWGPDGKVGTADDGTLSFPLPCAAGYASEVRIEPGDAETVVLVATGRGSRGATRVIERGVRRVAPDTIEAAGWRER